MGRGPSYPYVDLEGAIAYARKVYDFAKRGAAPVEAVVKEGLKLSPTSSGSQKVIAALRSFGLVEDAPGTNGKLLKLSNRAIRILLDDQDSMERQEEIKRAALAPKWYEYCWSKWGKDMPPAMRSNLLIEHGFVESTVDGFLSDYRKTIAFAGLLDEAIFSQDGKSTDENKDGFKIGDWVQWETQGCLRMPEAKRIASFLDGGKFVTVEGSTNPVPYAELIPAEEPGNPPPPHSQNIFIPALKPIAQSPAREGERMLTETLNSSAGISMQINWPTAINKNDYDDFLYLWEGVRRKVERAIKADSPSQSEPQLKEGQQ